MLVTEQDFRRLAQNNDGILDAELFREQRNIRIQRVIPKSINANNAMKLMILCKKIKSLSTC